MAGTVPVDYSLDATSPDFTNLKNRQSRKRKINENDWKRNVLKHINEYGESNSKYVTRFGNIKRSGAMHGNNR